MDKDTKVKFKNAAEIVGGGIGLGVLAAVAVAIEPVFGLVRSGRRLSKQKEKNGAITEQDVKNAIKFYGKHLLAPVEVIKLGVKEISKDVSTRTEKLKTHTPEEMQKSGVADLIKLIEHVPSVEVYENEIKLGDMSIVRNTKDVCIVGMLDKNSDNGPFKKYNTLLTFPAIYWDMVEDVALERRKQIEQQTFSAEVAKRIGNGR